MKISNLFGRSESTTATQYKKENEAAARNQTAVQGGTGDDRVTISPLYRQINQISAIIRDDESARQSRVQELKAKVAAGDYNVSSSDVAKSIVDFAKDSEFEQQQ
jgi:flagellar biosynthesis anti-sigma factor FlgM